MDVLPDVHSCKLSNSYWNLLVSKALLVSSVHIEIDLIAREVWHVVAIDGVVIVLPRILLRQQERLRGVSLVIDTGQVEEAVEAILTARGEDDPATVAAPVVIALGLIRVGSLQGVTLSGAEVEQPEVTLLMVNREVAKIRPAVE